MPVVLRYPNGIEPSDGKRVADAYELLGNTGVMYEMGNRKETKRCGKVC